MVEKFSDYEGGFLDKEGEFIFTITDYELADGPKGPVAKFDAKSSAGTTIIRHSLTPKARWSYNKLIKACLRLETAAQIEAFECDYEVIGASLVGKKFVGVVKCETYQKDVKVPNDDGTFRDDVEVKDGYKITDYKIHHE